MASYRPLLLAAAVLLLAVVSTQATCTTTLDTCYQSYQATAPAFSFLSSFLNTCTHYFTLKTCVDATLIGSPAICNATLIAAHSNIQTAYASNSGCNGAGLAEVSLPAIVVLTVVASVFRL